MFNYVEIFRGDTDGDVRDGAATSRLQKRDWTMKGSSNPLTRLCAAKEAQFDTKAVHAHSLSEKCVFPIDTIMNL